MGSTKWLVAVAAALLLLLSRTAPAHADAFRLVVRITSGTSRALSDRIRGQTSDLVLDLVTVDTGPLDPSLPSQVGSSTTIAQVYSADAVVWFDDLALGPAHEDRLFVLQAKAKRLLVRGVGDPGIDNGKPSTSASAELEAAALIVRAAVQAMMEGGVIGVEQARIVGTEAPKPKPLPPPAEPAPYEAGDAPTALPGIFRLPIAGPIERLGVGAAGTVGYGFTESVLGEGDINQRLFASAAASLRPNEWLAVALRLDGRYDWHRHVATGDASGWVGEPHIDVRFDPRITGDLHVGVQAAVGLPGGQAPSISFAATSPELSLFATYARPNQAFAIASLVGFRLDRGIHAIADPILMTRAQLLSVGVSDTNALLLGIGAVGRVAGAWQALGEWTWDLRVPANGSSALESPMRLDAGARLTPEGRGNVQFQALIEVSPSARPAIGPGEPLVLVEPRVSFVFGVNLLAPRPASSQRVIPGSSASSALSHR